MSIKTHKGDRFVVKERSGAMTVFVDTETGVNYLFVKDVGGVASGSGLTVLVDADGKPIVTKE